ncbi:ABC transporter ATP-binding protein [Eubacteriales bacterium OttesenSCG-928-N13]|nr:ABC transporter ATP-binding protein [Eubacteriales bacterium OttesenSCG-928-N13]
MEHLTKSFDGNEVIRDISLDVHRGEFITLLGPSGCGKTTTLRIIAGLTAPDSGRVLLSGRDVTDLVPNKRNVNTVFQNYALFPHMNVERNIGYGLRVRGENRSEIQKKVNHMLELVQLSGYGQRMPSQLSGGQRQRVAIARAVVVEPDVLLLDEPLGALDLQLRQQMQLELKHLQQQLGITFIYITHDQEEALNMSDRIAIMYEGQFEQIGTPAEIYEYPRTRFAAQFIGQGSLFEGEIQSIQGDTCQVKLPSGTIQATCPPMGATIGERVAASIHSERIRYDIAPQQGFNLPAKVLSHRFSGSMLRTELQLNAGETITALGMEAVSELPPVGSDVYIHWLPRHCTLIKDS